MYGFFIYYYYFLFERHSCCYCPINSIGIVKIPSAGVFDSFGEWCEFDNSRVGVVLCQMKKKICFWLYMVRSNRVSCAFNNSF